MKSRKFILVVLSSLIFISCGTIMVTKSPEEVKAMTTRQFYTNKNLVIRSVISLLQSESYLINNVNNDVGLITASKRLGNRNAAIQRFLLGFSNDANTAKVSFYVEEYNPELSVVKLTIYEGSESTVVGQLGDYSKDVQEQMVYDPIIYDQWFDNLSAEIGQREALIP